MDEDFAAALREQMEYSLQSVTGDFAPGESDDHGRQMWNRCEALTAGEVNAVFFRSPLSSVNASLPVPVCCM